MHAQQNFPAVIKFLELHLLPAILYKAERLHYNCCVFSLMGAKDVKYRGWAKPDVPFLE